MSKTYMADRQVNDEKALRTLEPFIDALKASISMQKAVANHLIDLEKLRAYGYSNGFISAAVSEGSGRTISVGLLASMMYRARMKKLGTQTPSLDTSQVAPITPPLNKEVQPVQKPAHRTDFRQIRKENENENWEALHGG